MLKANSGGDGYPSNWVRVCDTCKTAACTLYCHNDSAYLCSSCNERIHAANTSKALPHERVWVFTSSENAPQAAFTCKADAASLCANPLAAGQVPIPPVPSLLYASTYPEELPGPMLNTTEEEIDEDETDSWLLLEPEDNSDNQTNGGFAYVEEPDESFAVKEYNSCTEHQCQDQNNQQQFYCPYQGDSGSDGIVPVQSFELKEQEGCLQHRQQQQQQHQQHNVNFNREFEASKAAIINTPSSGQSVHMSFINAGIVPTATMSSISSSYTRCPNGTTDIFPNFSLLMPLQFTPMNREAKVLRYREKRKARKFEKKIRYASRKAYAEARPRVKGRFARKTEMDFAVDDMFSTEEYGYGIVPSY